MNRLLSDYLASLESLLHDSVTRKPKFDSGTITLLKIHNDVPLLKRRGRLNEINAKWWNILSKYDYEVYVIYTREQLDDHLFDFESIEKRTVEQQILATGNQLMAAFDALAYKSGETAKAYLAGDPDTIKNYCILILKASPYPQNFLQDAEVAYVPESKQLVVAYTLPSIDTVPPIESYKFNKKKGSIIAVPRPAIQRKSLYLRVIAQVTLRTIHELFRYGHPDHMETIVFNGYIDAIDPGTGQPVRPCVVTVRTTRDVFQAINLDKVDPTACLKVLNASLSRSPSDLAPVRPILEFNMVDPRFIEQSDVLGQLDQRPNLMDLSPGEFESLISNLFESMGLETRLTQASRDGGVDCVAYDLRPILGGKVVIQAKRYKHTVGVTAVRDLFGTVHNEGASKGILVTTSGYGKAAFDFAQGKPLELLSGSNLLFLLKEHAGIDARIIIPEDWQDPA